MIVFIDDILIYSRNEKEHEEHLKLIFELLKKEELYAKFLKCEFWHPKLQLLGHVIDSEGIHIDPDKIKSIKDWLPKTPTRNSVQFFRKITAYQCLYFQINTKLRIDELYVVNMDDPNISMKEYIRLEEEKARKRGKVFNWETAKYVSNKACGRIWLCHSPEFGWINLWIREDRHVIRTSQGRQHDKSESRSFRSLKKSVVNIANTSTNKAFQVRVDPSHLQSPFNSKHKLFAPCHVLLSLKSRIHTRIEPLNLEFLNSVIQYFQNTCQRTITKLVYFVEPHDLSFIIVDRENYCSRRLNEGIIMLELEAFSIPSWFSEVQLCLVAFNAELKVFNPLSNH
ncbi:ribonuclease H-like domain-containing protein [Tanacetum coccineum]